jgi:hypothetical protein
MKDPQSDALPTSNSALRRSDRGVRALILSICSVVALLTYARLYFGVDLDDEAFHVVVPYRYALGARPFVDEVNLSQIGAGLVAYPLVAAYYHLIGLDGIVLFSRHMYLLFAIFVTAALFFSLRTLVRRPLLVLPISLLALAFIPQNTPSLNYNSLGNGLFAAGCFLGVADLRSHRRRYVLLAGVAHGVAMFCYPPLALPVAVYAAAYYVLSSRSGSALIPYVATAAMGGIAWIVVLLSDGVDTARDALTLAGRLAEERDTGIDRAVGVMRDAAANFALAPLALGALTGAMLLRDRRPNAAVGLLAIVPLLAVPARPVDLALPGASVHFIANLGVLALPLFYFLREHALCRWLLVGVWIPGFVAGSTISWSTFDPGGHQGLGFFGAAIATVLLLALSICRVIRQHQARVFSKLAPFLPVLAALAALVALQYATASHDGRPPTLTSRIDGGAYSGLMTRPENARFLRSLTRDLERIVQPECTTLFYYGLPAGYLLVPAVPATNTAFLSDRGRTKEIGRRLVSYYARRDQFPDVAVRLTRIPYLAGSGRPRYLPDDPLDALIRSARYRRALTTASYSIFTLRSGACGSA